MNYQIYRDDINIPISPENYSYFYTVYILLYSLQNREHVLLQWYPSKTVKMLIFLSFSSYCHPAKKSQCIWKLQIGQLRSFNVSILSTNIWDVKRWYGIWIQQKHILPLHMQDMYSLHALVYVPLM